MSLALKTPLNETHKQMQLTPSKQIDNSFLLHERRRLLGSTTTSTDSLKHLAPTASENQEQQSPHETDCGSVISRTNVIHVPVRDGTTAVY